MTYTLRESNNSKNYTPNADVLAVFKQPRVVKYLTIHHWGSLGQRFNDVENFLCTNNTPTSAHYVVQDGLVSCIVTPDDAAWHSGNAVGNATSVGLELRPEATDGDYRTAAELIHFLRGIYGDVPLVPHNYWYATACPGKWDLARLDREARSVGGSVTTQSTTPTATVTPAPKPAPAPAPAPSNGLYWIVERGDTMGKIADYYGVTVTALARHNGIANPALISVGQRISIPGPLVWIVDPGDTLAGIAAHYGMDVSVVAAKNGIKNYNLINVGQVIKIL